MTHPLGFLDQSENKEKVNFEGLKPRDFGFFIFSLKFDTQRLLLTSKEWKNNKREFVF